MIVYHGSNVIVQEPKIIPPNRLLDFGNGFYTTSSHEQACRWARRVNSRQKTECQIINVYELHISRAKNELLIIQFNSPSHEWLHFVTTCRSGKKIDRPYDIAIGPVANDNVYAAIQLFETGLLSEAETITSLKVEELFNQILFHTEKALEFLIHIRHEIVKDHFNE